MDIGKTRRVFRAEPLEDPFARPAHGGYPGMVVPSAEEFVDATMALTGEEFMEALAERNAAS